MTEITKGITNEVAAESSQATPAQPTGGRFQMLDALRGIAILMVLAVHIVARGGESTDTLIFPLIWPLAKHGYLGVDLFFMISGYCITLAAFRSLREPYPARVFLTRRILRIFPPYLCGVLLVVALAGVNLFLLKQPYPEITSLGIWDWIGNLTLMQGVMHTPDLSLPFWSLTVEFQFYLLISLLLMLGKSRFLIGLAITSLTLAIIRFAVPGLTRNYLPDLLLHFCPFICGMIVLLLCERQYRDRWAIVCFSFAVLLSFFLSLGEEYRQVAPTHSYHLPNSIRCLLAIVSIPAFVLLFKYDSWLAKRSTCVVLAHFGLISYSLYLTHIPIGTRCVNLAYRYYGLKGVEWIPVISIALIICYLFALLFFYFIEKPSINLSASACRKQRSTTS